MFLLGYKASSVKVTVCVSADEIVTGDAALECVI